MRTRRDSDESGSERTCVVTGTKDAPEAMLRFALCPDGSVVPDIRRKLPGRGVWTRLSFATVSRAAAKQAFSRAFRAKAEAPASLAETVDELLERDALQFLSIVNKAGLVVAGAFKVESAIEAGRGRGADPGERRRSRRGGEARPAPCARGSARGLETIARVNLFTSRQLDLALGRANVIHAALKRARRARPFSQGWIVCAAIARAKRRGDQDRERRRAGRRGRNAWQAGRIG